MFANTFQSGFISVFYSVGSNPLAIWDKQVKCGHIRRVVDEEVRSLVLEIGATNVTTTYITCPQKARASLGIRLPFLVMIIKNMKKYFTFEIQIKDDKDMHRRFRVSNFQSTTKVRPFCTTMPIGLAVGWNQVQFNLADFTKRAYGSTYVETVRLQIHANVRIRRIYFCDMLYHDDDLPTEFKLFIPIPGTKTKPREAKKPLAEAKKPSKEKVEIDLGEEEGEEGGEEGEKDEHLPSPAAGDGPAPSEAAEPMLSPGEGVGPTGFGVEIPIDEGEEGELTEGEGAGEAEEGLEKTEEVPEEKPIAAEGEEGGQKPEEAEEERKSSMTQTAVTPPPTEAASSEVAETAAETQTEPPTEAPADAEAEAPAESTIEAAAATEG